MSPVKRKAAAKAAFVLPEAVDQWRSMAGARAARCLRIQTISAVRLAYRAIANDDVHGETVAHRAITDYLLAAERLEEGQFRAEIVTRTGADRYVLAGRALDEAGQPLVGAEVTVTSADEPNVVIGAALTDATGRYLLDGPRDNLNRVLAEGGGIVETVSHERIDRPVRAVVAADRINPRMTVLDEFRPAIVTRPVRRPRPPGRRPTRPSGPPAGPGSVTDPVPLNSIAGIGERRQQMLERSGISDVQSLARADAREVGEALGMSPKRAEALIRAAQAQLRNG